MSELNPEFAAKLKEEGNKFFVSKQYSQAYDKYSKALNVGGDNAVIYSNRAACCLNMGRYLDACSDARKATELDPTYAKAWGRLGTAQQELGSWKTAIKAYETALAKLPQNGLTSAEQKQKEQYETGLSLARKKMEPVRVHRVRELLGGKRPWERAAAILESAQERGHPEELVFSSANVINMAANDFRSARDGMRQMRKVPIGNGQMAILGRVYVLQDLTNAILSDRRSFFIDDPNWLTRYNEQITLQVENTRAWENDGPEVVLSEAQQRVRELGWEATRPALSTTVRAWIMRAFLMAGLTEDYTSAEQFYRNAIDVLQRGNLIWAGANKDERGAIFETTFIWGVRAIHLETFMKAHAKTGGKDSRFDAKRLDKLATDLLHEVEEVSREMGPIARRSHGEGFYLAYYVYPAAEACAIKAYSLKNMAKGKPADKCVYLWSESAAYYARAAEKLPQDDEYHCQYLMNSIGSWWLFEDAPLKHTLPLLAELKQSVPKMKKIWEHSAMSMDGLDGMIRKCLDYYEDVQRKMEAGRLTENDSYRPQFQV